MIHVVFITGIVLFAATSVFSILALKTGRNRYSTIAAVFFFMAALAIITVGFIKTCPGVQEGFFSIVSTIWGYFYILSIILILLSLYLYFSKWKNQWNSFMALIAPFITLILLISIPFFYSSRRFAADLHHTLLPAHILLAALGELLFFLSFVGSVHYLIMEWHLKKRSSSLLAGKLPNLESIEKFNKWAILWSLVLLSTGLVLGMIMTMVSFDSIFRGTAKEFHVYTSWCIILIIALLRHRIKISSHRLSIINILLFAIIMFLYVFTNIYIAKGFHSFQ